MATIDEKLNEDTLESLRAIRRKLFSVPKTELGAMKQDDRDNYNDCLSQTESAILKLETAKLKGVNDLFKKKEEELKNSAEKLQRDTETLNDAITIIKTISDGIGLITNVVCLLG